MTIDIQRPVFTTNTRPPKRGARRVDMGDSFDDILQVSQQDEAEYEKHESDGQRHSANQAVEAESSGQIDERI